MAEQGVDYKIRVDDSGLDTAAKKADGLEQQLGASEAAQTKRTKEGVNARTQLLRDGLAQNMRAVRENSQEEINVLKDKLKREEIDQKEFAAKYVQITKNAQDQIKAIKSQKAQLLPPEPVARGAGFGVGMGFAASALGVGVLSRSLMDLAEAGTNAQNVLEGLESVVKFKLGQDAVPLASKALNEITKTGLLSRTDGATALKNLTSMGYSLDQATTIIQRNTDIAIKNRQAHYSVSEAVKVFTEGVKNGNSVLTDSTGITENLEPMLRKYGFSAQDLGDKVNGAAARHALLQEVVKQTAPFMGDAEKASNTYTGAMAKMTQQADETKAALGKIAAEGLAPVVSAFTGGLRAVTDWFNSFSDGGKKIILFGTAIGLMAIPLAIVTTSAYAAAGSFTAMAVAAKAAFASLLANPVFLVAAGIAAVVAAIVGIHEQTRTTPGQALLVEKKQLDDLAKSTELNVEQKKRLADANKKLTEEYGPFLAALSAENTSYERKLQLLGALDRAQERYGRFAQLSSDSEFLAEMQRLTRLRTELATALADPSTAQRIASATGVGSGLFSTERLQNELTDVEASIERLQRLRAARGGTAGPTATPVRVPVIFVEDQTSLQVVRDRMAFNDQLLTSEQSMYLSIQIMRDNEKQKYEESLIAKRFALRQNGQEVMKSLDDLEREKNRLEGAAANATDQRQKNQLAAAQKHNQQMLDAVKRRIDTEKKLKSDQDNWNKQAAGEMFEFGQALLSAEEGAFIKYLANRLRAVTRAMAEEFYAKAAGHFAVGNFPLAALYAAGGAAVQIAGELGAQAIEKNAKKNESAPAPSIAQTSTPSASPSGGAVIQNNVDNSVVINQYGTYMGEADFIRQRIKPELAKIAAERGQVVFK